MRWGGLDQLLQRGLIARKSLPLRFCDWDLFKETLVMGGGL